MIRRPLATLTLFVALAAWGQARASQSTWVTPNAPLPMTALATFLNNALQAVGTCSSGPSAPTVGPSGAPVQQMCWWNVVTTPWVLNYWDGSQWVPVYGISPSSHAASFLGALPNPSASTLGGIESIAATTHQWIDSISTSGVPHQSQPAVSDLSGSLRQILAFGNNAVEAANVTVYCWSQTCNPTQGSESATAPIAGSLKNLSVNLNTAPGVGQSATFTLCTGTLGSATCSGTRPTCTISGTNTSCQDNSNSVAVSANQVMTLQYVSSLTAASNTGMSWGAEFDNP